MKERQTFIYILATFVYLFVLLVVYNKVETDTTTMLYAFKNRKC